MPASMSSTLGRHLRRLQSRCAPYSIPARQNRALQTPMQMLLAEYDKDETEANWLHAYNVWALRLPLCTLGMTSSGPHILRCPTP